MAGHFITGVTKRHLQPDLGLAPQATGDSREHWVGSRIMSWTRLGPWKSDSVDSCRLEISWDFELWSQRAGGSRWICRLVLWSRPVHAQSTPSHGALWYTQTPVSKHFKVNTDIGWRTSGCDGTWILGRSWKQAFEVQVDHSWSKWDEFFSQLPLVHSSVKCGQASQVLIS